MNDEALHQFAYYSTLSDGFGASCVGAVIKAARAFNATHGITGVLLFDGERFCQYIEGEPQTLQRLVDRIRQDPRHKDVVTLLHAPLAGGRRYPHWSMAFSDVEDDGIIEKMMAHDVPQDALDLLQDRHLSLDIG